MEFSENLCEQMFYNRDRARGARALSHSRKTTKRRRAHDNIKNGASETPRGRVFCRLRRLG
nr:MAG TPA: hypothetical protein [Caudoviricetes sp.]